MKVFLPEKHLSDNHRQYLRLSYIVLCWVILLSNKTLALETAIVNQPHIKVSLVSAVNQFTQNDSTWLAIRFNPDHHWHIYWSNPGDSGMPPRIQWQLPEGVTVSEPQWPFPESIPVQHLMNYGYHNELLLPVKIHAGDVQRDVEITANVSWLVCREECLPGRATLALTVPVVSSGAEIDKPRQKAIEKSLEKIPASLNLLGGAANLSGAQVQFEMYASKPIFSQAKQVEFFPLTPDLLEYGARPSIKWRGNRVVVTQQKSEYFVQPPKAIEGVFVVNRQRAWRVKLPVK